MGTPSVGLTTASSVGPHRFELVDAAGIPTHFGSTVEPLVEPHRSVVAVEGSCQPAGSAVSADTTPESCVKSHLSAAAVVFDSPVPAVEDLVLVGLHAAPSVESHPSVVATAASVASVGAVLPVAPWYSPSPVAVFRLPRR